GWKAVVGCRSISRHATPCLSRWSAVESPTGPPPMTSTWAATRRMSDTGGLRRLGDHAVLELADPLDLDPDHVARAEEPGRIHCTPDARGGAGRHRVARLEGEGRRKVLHLREAVDDQLAGVRVLPQLAIHPGTQLEGVRVAHLVG